MKYFVQEMTKYYQNYIFMEQTSSGSGYAWKSTKSATVVGE
jgi:hypothetical protein